MQQQRKCSLYHALPRYHSLMVEPSSLPACLEAVAWTCGGHHAVDLHARLQVQQGLNKQAQQESCRKQLVGTSGLVVAQSTQGAAKRSLGAPLQPPPPVTPLCIGGLEQLQPPEQQMRLLMAIAHRSLPHFGVQFHPESISTRYGCALLSNFLRMAAAHLSMQHVPR